MTSTSTSVPCVFGQDFAVDCGSCQGAAVCRVNEALADRRRRWRRLTAPRIAAACRGPLAVAIAATAVLVEWYARADPQASVGLTLGGAVENVVGPAGTSGAFRPGRPRERPLPPQPRLRHGASGPTSTCHRQLPQRRSRWRHATGSSRSATTCRWSSRPARSARGKQPHVAARGWRGRCSSAPAATTSTRGTGWRPGLFAQSRWIPSSPVDARSRLRGADRRGDPRPPEHPHLVRPAALRAPAPAADGNAGRAGVERVNDATRHSVARGMGCARRDPVGRVPGRARRGRHPGSSRAPG